ncbi:hypothetical protein L211DRAFT_842406 [Terfezia boudieri ATCC MYA-4762]|uniref:Uncharacterized protein n=1 Tax=Terfezia boudieri ATCC MYA-4762 TaxID=1051890 RepID=A0A3N4L9Y2_9PEZI|nr:hypothetical protein L211DRAFT_842406 [Terfezia boudieri ATCC MYA-4762]
MLSEKRLPSAAAAPCSSEAPPITTPLPPVYGSHNFDTPFPAPTTTTTEEYEQDTESNRSIEPPRRKKFPDCYLAFFITLAVLCTLFIVIQTIDWIITTEREKASLLAYG